MGVFSKQLVGRFSPFIFESLAIREGLLFAKDNGFRVSIVESDSITAVRAIKDLCNCAVEFLILNNIKILMQEVNGDTYSYISCSYNVPVHTLTKLALSLVEDQHRSEGFSNCINEFIRADLAFFINKTRFFPVKKKYLKTNKKNQ